MIVDSKGRISIPAGLRRNYNLECGAKIVPLVDLKENAIILVVNGQNGVTCSTKACGALNTDKNPVSGPYRSRDG